MYLLSYRGPSAAGGVSSALGALWSNPKASTHGWWHMADGGLVYSTGVQRPGLLQPFPDELTEHHYRFCNEFIWPLMHGFPREVVFDSVSCQAYKALQDKLLAGIDRHLNKDIFVHDYQFAMVTKNIPNSTFFWHIPWPASVRTVWTPFLRDLAMHIAQARKIGFHTADYAANFLNALDDRVKPMALAKIKVAPMPVDCELWEARALETRRKLPQPFAALDTPYIVSVDRADYTKGILQRLSALDTFFERYPQFRGKITFVQICQRTRAGIAAFDQYWARCRTAHERLNKRFGDGGWQPCVWVDTPFDGDDLALIYKNARGLLISSLRDGLNLTAKEYVACQNGNPGALILSRRTGVWHQLGEHAFDFEPFDETKCAVAIAGALYANSGERQQRIEAMRRILEGESLVDWAAEFAITSPPPPLAKLLNAAGH